MAYYQVMTLCIFLTTFALWRMNVLLGIVASAGWWAMLAMHLANPPTFVTSGSNIDTFIVLAIVGAALAIPIITLQQLRQKRYANSTGESGQTKATRRSLSELSTEEYRTHIRSRMRRRR